VYPDASGILKRLRRGITRWQVHVSNHVTSIIEWFPTVFSVTVSRFILMYFNLG